MRTSLSRPSPALVVATLSLVVSASGVAYAAGGGLVLGQDNTTRATTSLSAKRGPTLDLENRGRGPAAHFVTRDGVAPFTVTSGARVDGLDADQLDGLDAGSFQRTDATPLTALVRASSKVGSPSASATTLAPDTEDLDPSGMHADGASDLVVPEDGTYAISATVTWDPSGSGYRRTTLLAGNRQVAAVLGPALDTPAFTIQNTSGVAHLEAGQHIEVEALQGSGSTLDVRLDALQVTWVGP